MSVHSQLLTVAQNAVQQNDSVGILVVIHFLNQIRKAPAVALVFCMLVSNWYPSDSILYFTSKKTWWWDSKHWNSEGLDELVHNYRLERRNADETRRKWQPRALTYNWNLFFGMSHIYADSQKIQERMNSMNAGINPGNRHTIPTPCTTNTCWTICGTEN